MPTNEREVLEIPGSKLFELPPLLISTSSELLLPSQEEVMEEIQDDGLIKPEALSYEALADMATNFYTRYKEVANWWCLGKAIYDWTDQCEITFREVEELKLLIQPDLWPRADKKNVAELLVKKSIYNEKKLMRAVGTHLAFRKLPPLNCLSDGFLFYLGETVVERAYDVWAINSPSFSLPPERFHFQVISI